MFLYPGVHPEVNDWIMADVGQGQEQADRVDIRKDAPEKSTIITISKIKISQI